MKKVIKIRNLDCAACAAELQEELSDELALQIKEIATTQLKCGFENVTIIQSAS